MKSVNPISAVLLCTALFSSPLLAAPAGALDPTYGLGGKRTVQLVDVEIMPHTASITDDAGRVYLIAEDVAAESGSLRIARVHHDGAIDTTFGEQGLLRVDRPHFPNPGFLVTAAMQKDGRVILAFDRFQACRLNLDWSLDTSFGEAAFPGCATFEGLAESYVRALLVQPDGDITLVGYGLGEQHGIMARMNSSGVVDKTFGEDGVAVTPADVQARFHDAALASNGDIITAGMIVSNVDTQNYDFMIARFSGVTGEAIDSFGDGGIVTAAFDEGGPDRDVAVAVQILSDGGIAAAGDITTDSQNVRHAGVLKLASTGKPDLSFGPNGKRSYDPCAANAFSCEFEFSDLAILPNERLVLGATITPGVYSYEYNFLVMRIAANGLPDSTFGNNPDAPGSVVIELDLDGSGAGDDFVRQVNLDGERILVVGTAEVATDDFGDSREDFALVRLDHGLPSKFDVTPIVSQGGTLSPSDKQIVRHSDRAEFEVFPDPGYAVHAIGNGPANCGGGMDGNVYVTAPIVKHCIARVTFKPVAPDVFADSFE